MNLTDLLADKPVEAAHLAFWSASKQDRDAIRAALRAEDQEAIEPRPVVDLECEAAGAVCDLRRARDRRRLRRLVLVEPLAEVRHGISSPS